MFRRLIKRAAAFVTLVGWTAFAAASVTFSSATVTANDPGFLTSLTTSSTGSRFSFDLGQDFSQSNFASFQGELTFSLHASSVASDIVSVMITYFGAFDQGANADYVQTVDLINGSGSFSTSPFSTGGIALTARNATDISGTLTLWDNGLSAAISKIQIDIAQATGNRVPEPAGVALAAVALALLVAQRRRSSR